MKKNIVLFLCDDLRFDALGCMGNPIVNTPNLDRLAAAGTLFTRCYMPAMHPHDAGFHARYSLEEATRGARDEDLASLPRNPAEIRQHLADYYAMTSRLLRPAGPKRVGRALRASRSPREGCRSAVACAPRAAQTESSPYRYSTNRKRPHSC